MLYLGIPEPYLGVPEPYLACMREPGSICEYLIVHTSQYLERTWAYLKVPGTGSIWAYQVELGQNLGVPKSIWAYLSYKMGIPSPRSYASVPEHT